MNKYIQQIVNKYSFIYKPSSTNFRLKFIESNRAVKKSRPPPKMSGNFRQSDYGWQILWQLYIFDTSAVSIRLNRDVIILPSGAQTANVGDQS